MLLHTFDYESQSDETESEKEKRSRFRYRAAAQCEQLITSGCTLCVRSSDVQAGVYKIRLQKRVTIPDIKGELAGG